MLHIAQRRSTNQTLPAILRLQGAFGFPTVGRDYRIAVLLHSHLPSVDDIDAFLRGLAAQLAPVYRVAVVGIVADADVFYACRLRRLPLVGVYLHAIIIGFCHARSSCRCNATFFPSCYLGFCCAPPPAYPLPHRWGFVRGYTDKNNPERASL